VTAPLPPLTLFKILQIWWGHKQKKKKKKALALNLGETSRVPPITLSYAVNNVAASLSPQSSLRHLVQDASWDEIKSRLIQTRFEVLKGSWSFESTTVTPFLVTLEYRIYGSEWNLR
jgi:hypothetical protein